MQGMSAGCEKKSPFMCRAGTGRSQRFQVSPRDWTFSHTASAALESHSRRKPSPRHGGPRRNKTKRSSKGRHKHRGRQRARKGGLRRSGVRLGEEEPCVIQAGKTEQVSTSQGS